MLDIRWIRSNVDEVRTFLANRLNDFDVEPLVALDDEKRALLAETEELKARRNEGAKQVGAAKARGEDASGLMEEMRVIGERVREADARLAEIEETNSVHPRYRPDAWQHSNHYIFWFHDTTFECIAESFSVELHDCSVVELLAEACRRLVS